MVFLVFATGDSRNVLKTVKMSIRGHIQMPVIMIVNLLLIQLLFVR